MRLLRDVHIILFTSDGDPVLVPFNVLETQLGGAVSLELTPLAEIPQICTDPESDLLEELRSWASSKIESLTLYPYVSN